MKNGSILVVDDEPINFKLLNAILEREGYSVSYASNGSKAIEMATKTDYNLIIMDLKMPEINGIETARQIKKIKPNTNIVASSAINNMERNEYLLFNDFISKPINRGQLLEIVEKFAG
ncbi:MAG: response regulator [Bacteroidales bacterium]|nr:response regulator [Bacteroidales bacterium]